MTTQGRHRTLTTLVVDRYVNLEMFYKNQQAQDSGCINWTGVTSNVGYGFIGFRPQDPETQQPKTGRCGMMTVHRLAYLIANGCFPTQRNVNHTCHNKLCVNPTHLVGGTQRDKLDAMMLAGIKGGRKKGDRGHSYDHKQHRREYKYDEATIQWVRAATIPEIQIRFDMNRERANKLRAMMRDGYRWLPMPEYERLKPGRPRKEKK